MQQANYFVLLTMVIKSIPVPGSRFKYDFITANRWEYQVKELIMT